MYWQTYVDEQLIGSGYKNAAILGQDGTTLAASPGFSVRPYDFTTLTDLFDIPESDLPSDFQFQEVRYIVVSANEKRICGRNGDSGVNIVNTAKAIIIGVYDGRMNPGVANKAIQGVGVLIESSA